jgi:D-arabinose 1-dehydrogenase-like Zn-dependent alcohol dehydrogenase
MRSYDVTEFGAPLEPADRPTPDPRGSEVLLRTLAAGVCHSDLHIWEGYYDLGGGKRLTVRDRGLAPPITLGHEIVGEVVAFGPEATGVRRGDRVVAHPWIGCGDCAVCRSGDEQLCNAPRFLGIHRPGGYADHVLVPHPRYLVGIGRLTPAQAAPYACSGLTAFGALKRLGDPMVRERTIVLIGAGGLGLMCLTLMQALGAKGAVVADVDARKREAALAAGARGAVDAAAPDALQQLQAAAGEPVAGVIDFVGASSTARLGIDALARGGKYVIVGLFGGEIALSLPLLPMRALTVQGSYVGSLAELEALMALVASGRVPPMPVTEHRLEQANEVLAALKGGRVLGRAVLTP